MEWSIRSGKPSDRAELHALCVELLESAWSGAAIAAALDSPASRVRVAEVEGGRVVGFVLGRRISDLLEIDLVGVATDLQRRGVARSLLRSLVGDEMATGLAEARLELSESNAGALALYLGLDFMVVGRRSRYYPDGEDALLLSSRFPGKGVAGKEPTDPMSDASEAQHAPIRGRATVLANEADGSGRRLRLAVPGWPGSNPGQFLMIGPGAISDVPRSDPLLPRPMAVYRDAADSATAEVEVLYQIVGRGTTLLSEMKVGQSVGLVGPLGRGFPIEPGDGLAILVGGGTGIASLYSLARALLEQGRPVLVILGARGAAGLLARDDFAALDAELICTTEDGSEGLHGLVTEPLADRLARDPAASVFAVGPTPMMKACADLAAQHGAECFVSLENPMACGFGVCLGCAAPRREGGFSLVCRAGPVFDATEIDWEGLP